MSRNSRKKHALKRKRPVVWRFVGGPRNGDLATGRERGADELWVLEQEVTDAGDVVREAHHHYLSNGQGQHIYQGEIAP